MSFPLTKGPCEKKKIAQVKHFITKKEEKMIDKSRRIETRKQCPQSYINRSVLDRILLHTF